MLLDRTSHTSIRQETPVYQFSAKETWSSWNWKERFPEQQDVHGYMRNVSKVLKLYDDMHFNTRVSKAVWHETSKRWAIYVKDKLYCTTQFFIPCTGYAGQKYVPNIKGLETFKHAYHTSEWPENTVIKDKRVGVLGTGSSGMQTIETVGPQVKHLTVFQRTPNLANPRHQEQLTAESEAAEQKNYAERYAAMNTTATGLEIHQIDRNTFDDSISKRLETYEMLWKKGAQNFWFGNYKDLLTDRTANREAYGFWRDKTRARINDPVRKELLAPMEPPYAFGTKRPSLESSYFEVYNQPNVDLVDLKSDAIAEVTPTGVRMTSGKFYELDVIVLATGYDFGIGSQLAIDIRGVNNMSLREKWGMTNWPDKGTDSGSDGVMTQLGIMSAGFPNMLLSCGPQAPTAFGITPRMAELQGDWMSDCMEYVRKHGSCIDTTVAAERAWKQKNQEAADKLLIGETDSWYMGNNIPGRRKEPMFWFGGIPEYMEACHSSAKQNYKGFIIS